MQWSARAWSVLGGLAIGLAGCGKPSASSDGTESWWLLPDLGDEDDGAEDEAGETEDDEDVEAGGYFWGEAALVDGSLDWGALGFYAASEDGTLTCEVEYSVASAVSAAGCDACAFAYAFTYGALDVSEGEGSTCERFGWTELEGQSIMVGASGETLMVLEGSDWVEAGESEQDGSDWFFEGRVE
ncbi:MAG TPA: hypothetical protein DFR83_04330 [Deltaproteobacteria bacterium]|nr:hypothetical protein [Deltaproteobacteria bacterium]